MIKELIIGGLLVHVNPVPKQVEAVSFKTNVIVKDINDINYLAGNNSIGEPILGLGYDIPLVKSFKFKVGAYIQDSSKFKEIGVTHLTGDLVPILGIESFTPIHDSYNVDYPSIGISTLITPELIFSGISFRWSK